MIIHSDNFKEAFEVLRIREKLEANSARQLGEDLAEAIIKVKATVDWLQRSKRDYLHYNKLVNQHRRKLKLIENDPEKSDYIKYAIASEIQDFEHEKIKFAAMYKKLNENGRK